MNGHKAIQDIDALINKVGGSRHAACLRSGINYSTVHRWNNGAECKPENLARLRVAVLSLAQDAGKKLTKPQIKELGAGITPAKPSITERLESVEARLAIVEQRA